MFSEINNLVNLEVKKYYQLWYFFWLRYAALGITLGLPVGFLFWLRYAI